MTKKNPYQDHVDRLWILLKYKLRAQKNGYWIEALSLSYVILEIELRLLLSSKAGTSGVPISKAKIESQKYLLKLANTAKEKGFIDQRLWDRIKEFNEIRNKTIHGLAQGDITYEDLEKPISTITELVHDIQNQWIPYTIGPA